MPMPRSLHISTNKHSVHDSFHDFRPNKPRKANQNLLILPERGGGHSNMKVTYMLLPAFEVKGQKVTNRSKNRGSSGVEDDKMGSFNDKNLMIR